MICAICHYRMNTKFHGEDGGRAVEYKCPHCKIDASFKYDDFCEHCGYDLREYRKEWEAANV